MATALTQPSYDWGLRLHFPDTLDLLSERDWGRYRLQRRLIGPLYQAKNLQKYEKSVDAVLRKLVAQLEALDAAEVDLKEWMHILAVECLASVVLSWSPGYLKQKSDCDSSQHAYAGWKRKSVFGLFPSAVKAQLLSKSAGRLFARLWGIVHKTPEGFKPFFPVNIPRFIIHTTQHLLTVSAAILGGVP